MRLHVQREAKTKGEVERWRRVWRSVRNEVPSNTPRINNNSPRMIDQPGFPHSFSSSPFLPLYLLDMSGDELRCNHLDCRSILSQTGQAVVTTCSREWGGRFGDADQVDIFCGEEDPFPTRPDPSPMRKRPLWAELSLSCVSARSDGTVSDVGWTDG
jgi:hypothetical protein